MRQKLFSDVLKPLGGNLKMIICGGAALSQDTIDFLDDIGITVYNGYGITECSPVVLVNPSAQVRKNSVGLLLPTMKVRISEPDEFGNGDIGMLTRIFFSVGMASLFLSLAANPLKNNKDKKAA